MNRSLVTLSLVAAVLTGCSGEEDARPGVDRVCEPGIERLPCDQGVEAGTTYRYLLLTHCGIEWAYLGGRYWVPNPNVGVPSDWTPIQRGAITLVDAGEARYESDTGGTVRFVPAPPSFRPQPCA